MIQHFFKLLRTTLAGGILFLVPIILIIAIGDKALTLAHKLVAPLAAELPVKSIIGLETPKLLAIILLVLACFIAGILARAALAEKWINWLETSVLSNLPGYEFMKAIIEELLGVENKQTGEVVLARLENAWQLAFVMERIETGHLAVFVPNAPNPRSGSVYFLTEDRVKPVKIPLPAAMKCLKRLGVGSNALLRDHLPKPEVTTEKAKPVAAAPGT